MKLWELGFDQEKKHNFPQVLYKGFEVDIAMEGRMLFELFKIFHLTHRDKQTQIKLLESNMDKELPYRELYEMIFPPKEVEFQTEYLVDLLNTFEIEVKELDDFQI